MNALASRWRRWAGKLAQHAAVVMRGDQSPWADAMRREIDYIEDDAAALRWAFGGLFACYLARLMDRPWPRTGAICRQAAICGALMFVIGLALQDRAGGQTEPAQPAADETICDQPKPSADRVVRPQDHGSNRISPDSGLCRSDCRSPSAHERSSTCKMPDPASTP